MSEIRNLLEKLDRIDERQQWDSLDAVVDQYAKPGMTEDDLRAMERAAIDVQEVGDGGFLSNLRAAGRSLVSNKYFRVNYVLYHAGEKLGLRHGLIGSDGKLRTMTGSQYGAEQVRADNATHRNIALAQARLNILTSRVRNLFQIPQGGGDLQAGPERELWFTPNARSLQSHNISDYRGVHPYADIQVQNRLTRVYVEERYVDAFLEQYPDANVMKADGSGPLRPAASTSTDGGAAVNTDAAVNTAPSDDRAIDSAAALANNYRNSLDDFMDPQSGQGGIANNPEAVGAIKELNTRLSNLGFTNVQADSEEYSAATRQAVRDFQTAYNRMYQATYSDQASRPNIEPEIRVDGDFGPNTFKALESVEDIFETIERLVAANSTENSSIQYKSSISKMLEESFIFEELSSSQLGELTGSIIAIDKFIGGAGENFALGDERTQLLINARTLLNDWVKDMSAEPAPNIVRMSNGSITPIGSSRTDTIDGGGAAVTGGDGEQTKREEAWEMILNNDLPEGWPEGYELWKNRDGDLWYVQPPGDNEPASDRDLTSVDDALAWANEHKGQGQAGAAPSREASLIARIIHDGVEDGFIRIDRSEVVDGLSRVADDSPQEWEDVVTAYQQEYNEDLIDILRTACNRNLNFVPQFIEQMQRINAPHSIPMNPRMLDLDGATKDRLFGPNFEKYEAEGRNYVYVSDPIPGERARFGWGRRRGVVLSGAWGTAGGTWEWNTEEQTLILRNVGNGPSYEYTEVTVQGNEDNRTLRVKNTDGEFRTLNPNSETNTRAGLNDTLAVAIEYYMARMAEDA